MIDTRRRDVKWKRQIQMTREQAKRKKNAGVMMGRLGERCSEEVLGDGENLLW